MKMRNLLQARRNDTGRSRRGFTLMEMLVVILILSILAALILPRLIGRTTQAKIAKAQSDIATLSSTLQAYRLDNDHYPSSEDGLTALRTKPSDATNWHGPYTQKDIPNDPWGNPYTYQSPGPDGQDYLITSYGSDGAPGGDDDAADITSDSN